MASPGDSTASRRRTTNRQHSAEDQALSQVAKEGESRLAARRAARAEAREIRQRELERQQREQEEREKEEKLNGTRKDFNVARCIASSNSSRRGSDESTEDTRELRKELSELEEKYKRSMVNNALLDNEKQVLRFQVDLMKDEVDEMEEALVETQRELKERNREFELKKRDFTELEAKFDVLNEQLKLRDALIQEHGLVFVSDETMVDAGAPAPLDNDVSSPTMISAAGTQSSAVLLSPETLEILNLRTGTLDERLRKFLDEKKILEKEIRKLKQDLEDEQDKRTAVEKYKSHSPTPNTLSNGPTQSQTLDAQAELQRQINDYKFKLKRAEQEITTLEGNVVRLESQVKRFKQAADNSEKVEEELKMEKRRFQKELRELQAQRDELEVENGHLQKRLEKLKKTSK